ncbi:small ribosomal subunit protein mS26-like [Asterias amurensis]|uniref:small ribosomal subunit protein mS26-like n=1 Tax=Asterias amurensis TaxID=7602 RepID=UPI003AB62088
MFPRCCLVLNRVAGVAGSWDPTLSAVTFQCVRWRKQRTDPRAKSKMNYRRIPTPIDPWEHDFLLKKNRHYACITRAMKKMFIEEISKNTLETAEGGSTEERAQKEREEYLQMLKWNDQENARTRLIREERLTEERRLKEENRLEKMIRMEEEKKQSLEELAERVIQEKEASKSYITLDNVDEAIERVMDNTKDFNFMISKTGDILLPEGTPWESLTARKDPDPAAEEDRPQELTQQL